MKKVFALLMVLVLACALCVPALAAGTTTYNATQLAAKRGEVPSELLGAFDAVVGAMGSATITVDTDAVKAIRSDVEAALNNTASAGTVDQVLTNAVDRLNAAVTGISVSVSKLSLDPMTGKVTVEGTVTVDGGNSVNVSANATAQKVKDTSGSSGFSSTTSNTAAAASSVIKATGFDTTAVVMVILAIAGVLGVATVKARKLD
ncbi:hypothetical protein [Allofournierella sp.]|uniref:hypothetical protein n=1 Tax=Allofournierella sp. TaxID=1940256 RepID=UPI003AB61583